jgi:Tol biopolymer transport system component
LAGGPAHRLTHTGSRSSEIDSEAPEAAPNGRFVAFQRNEWIWTMRPDGSNQRRLTRGANPSISPDSDQVVASRGESLVVIGAAGGHERVVHPITRKKQFGELIRSAGWPVFSPDGRSIAFTYKRIVSAGPGNHASGRLAVFSLATGKLRILTGPALGGRHASWQSLR